MGEDRSSLARLRSEGNAGSIVEDRQRSQRRSGPSRRTAEFDTSHLADSGGARPRWSGPLAAWRVWGTGAQESKPSSGLSTDAGDWTDCGDWTDAGDCTDCGDWLSLIH